MNSAGTVGRLDVGIMSINRQGVITSIQNAQDTLDILKQTIGYPPTQMRNDDQRELIRRVKDDLQRIYREVDRG